MFHFIRYLQKKIKFANEEFSNFQYSELNESTERDKIRPIRSYLERKKKHLLSHDSFPKSDSPFPSGPWTNSIHTVGWSDEVHRLLLTSVNRGERKADTGILLEFLEADPAPARGNISLPS